jgi:hypothetical protein
MSVSSKLPSLTCSEVADSESFEMGFTTVGVFAVNINVLNLDISAGVIPILIWGCGL